MDELNRIYERIVQTMRKMADTEHLKNKEKYLRYKGDRGYNVEAICGWNDDTDEPSDVVAYFEIYYQVGHDDRDCCTMNIHPADWELESLREFIAMYE